MQCGFVVGRVGLLRPHGAQLSRPRQTADVGGENSFRASFHRRRLAVVDLQTWRKMSAEKPAMFPAIKPLRDLDRFSKANILLTQSWLTVNNRQHQRSTGSDF